MKEAWTLKLAPDLYNNQEMCNIAEGEDPYSLEFIPMHLNTQEMYKESVKN